MSTISPVSTSDLPLKRGRWVLDAAHSSVLFSIRHLGLSKVRGRFERFEATLDVGPSAGDIRVEATVDMASVNTNNDDRDAHIRNTDFFNVDKHPTMHFVSTGIAGEGSEWQLAGELTLNGTTRPVTLDVEFHGLEVFRDNRHAGFSVTGELRRSDFGIDFGMMPLGGDKLALADKVTYERDLEFVEPKE